MQAIHSRRWLLSICASLALFAGASQPAAADYPDRPIKIVVAFPAGGGTDAAARLVAAGLSERLKQSVIVENRPGAGGIIGTSLAVKAAPDGYTLLFSGVGQTTTRIFASNVPYDPLKDLTPIGQVGEGYLLLNTNPAVPARTLAEFITYAKANPGKLNFGYTNLTSVQLQLEDLRLKTGLPITAIPYKGSSEITTALMTNEIQLSLDGYAIAKPHIESGKVRVLAVAGPRRMENLPGVPTAAESGVPGYSADFFYGLFGPAGMPPEVVNRLSREIRWLVDSPYGAKLASSAGVTPAALSPEEFHEKVKDRTRLFTDIARTVGIKPQ